MVMYGYVWLYVAMWGYVWLSTVMCGYVWLLMLCRVVYGYI